MNFITNTYLINLIFFEISGTIKIHRESKDSCSLYTHHNFASEKEVDDFIRSCPYYSDELKHFLLSDEAPGILITISWFQQFAINTELWSGSDEWLYYDADYIHNPLLNKTPERVELGLPVIDERV
jgi:hypothetical protein